MKRRWSLFLVIIFLMPAWLPLFFDALCFRPSSPLFNEFILQKAAVSDESVTVHLSDSGSDRPRVGGLFLFPSFKWQGQKEIKNGSWGVASKMASVSFGPDLEPSYIIAPTLEGQYEFVNAFLLGYQPYKVKEKWMPLGFIASRMQYQYDKDHFQGREEVWLTSKQAWNELKGDCEDHAILLADWLIAMGVDARVVLGRYKNEGHAWVVVFADSKEYLLEATDKSKLVPWSAYPLAALLPDYHPEYVFNDVYLWKNTGSDLTVKYAGDQWEKIARFEQTN